MPLCRFRFLYGCSSLHISLSLSLSLSPFSFVRSLFFFRLRSLFHWLYVVFSWSLSQTRSHSFCSRLSFHVLSLSLSLSFSYVWVETNRKLIETRSRCLFSSSCVSLRTWHRVSASGTRWRRRWRRRPTPKWCSKSFTFFCLFWP